MKHHLFFAATLLFYSIGSVATLFYFSSAEQALEQTLVRNLHETTLLQGKHVATALSDGLNKREKELLLLAQDSQIQSGSATECSSRLHAVVQNTGLHLTDIVRTDTHGTLYCSSTPALVTARETELLTPETDQRAVSHQPIYSLSFTDDTAADARITLHVPVFDSADAFTGFIGGSVSVSDILFPDEGTTYDGTAMTLFTENGAILYRTQAAHTLIGDMLAAGSDSEDVQSIRYTDTAGTVHAGSSIMIETPTESTWYIAVTQSLDDLYMTNKSAFDSLRHLFIAVIAVTGLLSILSLAFILRWSALVSTEVGRKIRDIEKEKELSHRLAQDLQKFKMAVDSVDDHVVITDKNGIVLYANNAVKKITGYDPQELIGKKAGTKTLWGGLMEHSFYNNFWRQIKIHKKTFAGEITNKRKNGDEYIALITVSPILDERKNVVFFIGLERDITHAKRVDKAKTEFVSLASHQLRTPLSAINWYTELLLSGDAGEVTKEQNQHLQEIYASSKRMVSLVNALLNVSRIELGTFIVQPEPTDILELLRDVFSEQHVTIQKKHLVIKKNFDTIETLRVDPRLIRIVFQNLLSNAVKYTPEKGTITLSVKKHKKGTSFHDKRFTRSMIIVVISDTGYGIPKHQQHLLFQKLFRADNVKEKDADGTGLGLYIAKSIIEHSNGTIWFESEENTGSTFFVAMPATGMKEKKGTKRLD